jgi:uncharacterized protein
MRTTVTIKPNSTKGPLVELKPDGSVIVYVREIASDGQANNALIKVLASYYKVPKTHISIIRGHTSRLKLIEIYQ